MSRLRSLFRRKRNRYIGVAVGLISIIGAGAGIYVGTRSAIPYAAGKRTLLDLYAPRDIGAIPARASWGSLVRAADHCWLLQESSGNALDTGSGTTWDLLPTNSPRQGVVPSLPVAGTTIDATSEKATYSDTIGDLRKAGVTQNAGAQWSITIVASLYDDSATTAYLYDFGLNGQTNGYAAFISASGQLNVRADCGTLVTKTVTDPVPDGAWHCITVAYDGTSTAVYWDGATATMPAFTDYGTCTAGAVNIALGNRNSGGLTHQGGIARARVDYVALTLAQHQTLCGKLWDFNLTASKVTAADLAWTQTGSTRCFAQRATTALCVPGGLPSHAYSSTLSGFGWAIERDRTNRILDGLQPDCSGANWSCTGIGATETGKVAPDGSATATRITIGAGANQVEGDAASGYTASGALDLSFWVSCESDEQHHIHNSQGTAYGDWHLHCDEITDDTWTYVNASSAFIDVDTAWTADASGLAGIHFEDPDLGSAHVTVWGLTLSEVAGLSIIPTTSTAQSTGRITWLVDNNPPVYWDSTRGTMTMVADTTQVGNLIPAVKTVSLFSGYLLESIDHWYVLEASGAWISRCKLEYSTGTTAVVRWNSGAAVEPSGAFVECLIDDVQQTWATKRTTPYVPRLAAQDTLQLAADTLAPTMIMQRFTVESAP